MYGCIHRAARCSQCGADSCHRGRWRAAMIARADESRSRSASVISKGSDGCVIAFDAQKYEGRLPSGFAAESRRFRVSFKLVHFRTVARSSPEDHPTAEADTFPRVMGSATPITYKNAKPRHHFLPGRLRRRKSRVRRKRMRVAEAPGISWYGGHHVAQALARTASPP